MGETTGISWTEATWNPVPRFPGYEVSDDGRIRSVRAGRELTLQSRETGHLFVNIRIGGRRAKLRKLYVHAAMLAAFVGHAPEGHEARHLDGDPTRNVLENLAWGTRQDNVDDRVRHGRQQHGSDLPQAKLTVEAAREIRSRYRNGGVSHRQLGELFGVSHTTIRKVLRRERWAHA